MYQSVSSIRISIYLVIMLFWERCFHIRKSNNIKKTTQQTWNREKKKQQGNQVEICLGCGARLGFGIHEWMTSLQFEHLQSCCGFIISFSLLLSHFWCVSSFIRQTPQGWNMCSVCFKHSDASNILWIYYGFRVWRKIAYESEMITCWLHGIRSSSLTHLHTYILAYVWNSCMTLSFILLAFLFMKIIFRTCCSIALSVYIDGIMTIHPFFFRLFPLNINFVSKYHIIFSHHVLDFICFVCNSYNHTERMRIAFLAVLNRIIFVIFFLKSS